MDVGLTTLRESEIDEHRATAQSLVTNFVQVKTGKTESQTEIAGTRRRFVSTVSTAGAKHTHKVEFTKSIGALNPQDNMLSLAQHGLLFKTRRGLAVALAVGDKFAETTGRISVATCRVRRWSVFVRWLNPPPISRRFPRPLTCCKCCPRRVNRPAM